MSLVAGMLMDSSEIAVTQIETEARSREVAVARGCCMLTGYSRQCCVIADRNRGEIQRSRCRSGC
eukprot:1812268-Rhodomonas_salina.1